MDGAVEQVSEIRIENTTDEQASDMLAPQFPETPAWVPPVQVSGAAHVALANKFRRWSGWDDASLILDNPKNHVKDAQSEVGMVNSNEHVMYLNVDKVCLNPNRVILTINPFRLRQEAIITGIMLHEAGHARHSHWRDGETPENPLGLHDDGTPVTEQQMALACLMEEPRVEGLMARDAHEMGAARLGWTMRAAAAHLLPVTTLSAEPGQQIMDLITSWTLRAGRCISYSAHMRETAPPWTKMFTEFLTDQIEMFLTTQGDRAADWNAQTVLRFLTEMATSEEDTSTFMVDRARDVLDLLFKDSDQNGGEGAPMPGAVHVDQSGSGEGDQQQSENSDTSLENAVTAGKLAGMEQWAEEEASNAEAQAEKAEQNKQDQPGGNSAGAGSSAWDKVEPRQPTADERILQRDAERFLRGLIAPVERSKTSLSDSPAATVDGAALSAWKAGGQVRSPRFFKHTRREVLPSPPVDVAVLTDISGSMDELQHPQAVLAWALSAAMVDLSNFAGRGQQIRSCLIHWGDNAEVVQHVGQKVPGIREVPCKQGTYALGPAMRLIEDEMPGFLDLPVDGKPTNRLIVMFTDWDHSSLGRQDAHDQVSRALQAGVNIVTITPGAWSPRRSMLGDVLDANRDARGVSSVTRYDDRNPSQVWDEAAKALETAR